MTGASNSIMSALIAGAGIGGLTSAIALARRGVQVTVLERSKTLDAAGAGIQLGPNALHVLDALDVAKALEPFAYEPGKAVIRRYDTGNALLETPLNPGHLSRYGQKYLNIHRADLMNTLSRAATQAGVTLLFGEEVSSYSVSDSAVTIQGEAAVRSADVLIGADGIHSTVRAQLAGATRARFTGQTAWCALVSTDRLPQGLLPGDANVWVGPNKHLVAYYVRGGQLLNIVAVREQSAWAEESWRTKGDVNELRSAFDGWDPRVGTALRAVEDCYYWGLFDRPDLDCWTQGRVALLGDACHPMLPFMAQGAAMAIEDAWILAQQLVEQTDSVDKALARYQERRAKRTSWVRQLASRNATLYHASGPLEVTLRNLKLAAGSAFPAVANLTLDKVYGLDVTRLP